MKVPPEIWFAPVGRCIYCRRSGAELNAAGENAKLSPEHIIPFSFGGHWVLPEASCQTCADITGAIEGKCCNMMLRAFRVHADVPTRRKKKRPTHLIVLDGETPHSASRRDVAVEEAPGVVAFPVLGPPDITLGRPPNARIDMQTVKWWPTTRDAVERSGKLKAGGFSAALAHTEIPIGPFMRVLAKIAHGYVVSQATLDGFIPLLPDFILGQTPIASYYVGGTFPMSRVPLVVPPPQSEETPHQVYPVAVEIDGLGYIAVQIRLFAGLLTDAPVYTVIAGSRAIPDGDFRFTIGGKNAPHAMSVKITQIGFGPIRL
jgi:hypothetical protein